MDIVLAALFALVAGAGTAVSPCVLPVLPLALTGAATGGRRRPAGIAVGLAVSFAFVTLALAYVIAALDLPDSLLRNVSIVVLLLFGICLVIPPIADRLEGWLTRLVPQRAAARGGDGFGSGVLLGLSLGPIYAPCAGPILGAVLTVSASQDLSAQRLVTGLAYAVGTAGGVLLVLLAGRGLLGRLRANAGRLQQAMGVVMVAFALITLSGLDQDFQTEIASALPSWLVNPTDKLEKTKAASDALGIKARPSGLQDAGPAPEFVDNQKWFNTPDGKALTLAGLRAQKRVVLIDFWTYTCINCIRTQPHLKAWDARYRDDGLTIIGVHSPEFPFEKSADNVQRAIETSGLEYPVVQDNNLSTWGAWGNQYWPAEYLIDARGHVRYASFGEGDYDATESAIKGLLREAGRPSSPDGGPAEIDAVTPSPGVKTPETYLGSDRAQGWLQDPLRPGARDFGALPDAIPDNRFAYGGIWTLDGESAEAGLDARIATRFTARRVYLVLGGVGSVDVFVDGEKTRTVAVDKQELYTLVDLPKVETHDLELRVSEGVKGYAFTFG
jgi:cytochrome c biogenesis protein CcdA/thiol-disulfide isomerase/thioredoxin